MRLATTALLALVLAACVDAQTGTSAEAADLGAAAPEEAPPPTVESVVLALASMPAEGLWPRFSPAQVPVAVFDGEKTVLIGHPDPPDAFSPFPDIPGASAYVGRHPAVRGNMPTQIGGVQVATVMLDALGGMSPDRAAAVVAHERFHVHQLERHPDWSANELAVFQYPATDAQQLFDRRLETLALHRALQATTLEQSECWLRTALLLRRKRMRQLPEPVATFERDIERQEGLARYIERRAAGLDAPIDIAPNGYPPDEVRGRAYVTGEALAIMLDRYAPGWRDRVENAEDAPALDSLLWTALEQRPETSCGFSAAERASVLERASAAVNAIVEEREAVLRDFISSPGWTVRVIAETRPLWPQSFDPMSITRVGSARVLHERMLRAGNESGHIDVFGRRVLSTGYLDDPLASGIREVRVTGIPEQPAVASGEDIRVRIVAPGLELSFQDAHVVTNDQEITVRLR